MILMTIAAVAASGPTALEPVALVLFLAGPAGAGLVVCGIGAASPYYDGSCLPPIGGAYLGVLTSVPLAFVGCLLDDGAGGDFGCLVGGAVGFSVGYFLGTAVGATLGWHLGKSPRLTIARGGSAAGGRPPERVVAFGAPEAFRTDAARRNESRLNGFQVSLPLLTWQF